MSLGRLILSFFSPSISLSIFLFNRKKNALLFRLLVCWFVYVCHWGVYLSSRTAPLASLFQSSYIFWDGKFTLLPFLLSQIFFLFNPTFLSYRLLLLSLFPLTFAFPFLSVLKDSLFRFSRTLQERYAPLSSATLHFPSSFFIIFLVLSLFSLTFVFLFLAVAVSSTPTRNGMSFLQRYFLYFLIVFLVL